MKTGPARSSAVERVDRRTFLAKFAMLAAGLVGWRLDRAWPRRRSSGSRGTWSGKVRLRSFTIEAGRHQRLDPNRSTTVTLTGNLVVRGILEMRPANPGVVHTIRFKGIKESRMVGGGTKVRGSDVGLWVMGRGQLDMQGTPRRGWNRTGTDPSWRAGDEIRVAPTAPGTFFSFPLFAPGSPVPRAYPEVPPAEVFNLTRNVIIRGTRKGRAHIFIRSKRPQTIRHALLRYLGPPRVLGRYPLHFHQCRNGSRGSLVEGVVVRDCRSRGFVPHLSHGITFRDCVAYDVGSTPFWWDPPMKKAGAECREPNPAHACSQTNDTLYDHCLAAKVGPRSSGHSGQNGFYLAGGVGNACVDCVVVGNGGKSPAGAFHWPSAVNHDPNVWRFEDCVAHNNKVNGIYVWQNDNNPHVVDRFTAYHNGKAGIEHGAYSNPYHYRDSLLVANGESNLIQHSNSRLNERVGRGAGYTRARFVRRGRTERAHITSMRHKLRGSLPLEWIDCEFSDDIPVLEVDERDGGKSADLRFVRCLVGSGRDMEPSDVLITRNLNGTTVRGQRKDGTTWQIDPNGSVNSAPPFWTE